MKTKMEAVVQLLVPLSQVEILHTMHLYRIW
jgi:hypothetical protein